MARFDNTKKSVMIHTVVKHQNNFSFFVTHNSHALPFTNSNSA